VTESERDKVSDDDYVLTWSEARHLVQAVEDAFGAADLTAISNGFTDDAVARFADFPEMRGRSAIMAFLTARFARTLGYKLTKTLEVLTGNRLANTWAPKSGPCAAIRSPCGTRHSMSGRRAGHPLRR
jgi:hypothetical protein